MTWRRVWRKRLRFSGNIWIGRKGIFIIFNSAMEGFFGKWGKASSAYGRKEKTAEKSEVYGAFLAAIGEK